MRPVVVRAPAKINLHLGVGARRRDGYHPLTTVYQAVSLYDELTAAPADHWQLAIGRRQPARRGRDPARRDEHRHAGGRAARGPPRRTRPRVGGDREAGSGYGRDGRGSADGAAALVALDRLWDLGTSTGTLLQLAAELGSDVPFALLGGTALGTGRGELVELLDDAGRWWWTIVPSPEGMSTAAVYAHSDELHPDADPEPLSAGDLLQALATGDPRRLAATLHNDRQTAALDLRPDLAATIVKGEVEGALAGLVSGSGPTCVFLCDSQEAAVAVGQAFTRQGHERVLVAEGPVRARARWSRTDGPPAQPRASVQGLRRPSAAG
ncbi:MAG: 4-(cytidine 5'-diphospho)-2-C-methyl-D-erythritol kinase [Nocardioides sp.]